MERATQHRRQYAIVWNPAANAYYILETHSDEWQGPYASRVEAELALARRAYVGRE